MKRVKIVFIVLFLSLLSTITISAIDFVSVRVDVPTFSTWSSPVTRTKNTYEEQEITNLSVSGDKTLAFDVYRDYIGDSAYLFEFGTTRDTIVFDEGLQMNADTEYSLVTKTKFPKLFVTPASFVWWYN